MIHELVSSLPFVALVLAASPASAEVTKAQCVDANTNAQSLRREGSFSEARAMLAICGDPHCPALVRDDCTRQLDGLAQAQPTLVFDAKDRSGADVAAVRVKVDGRQVTEKLDGTPLPVDRGQHAFVFEVDGQPAVALTLLVKEGEKGRRVTVTVGKAAGTDATGGGDRGGAGGLGPPPLEGGSSSQRTLGLVAGGAGIVGLGVGTIFGLLAASKWSSTKGECAGATSCPSYDQAVADHGATVSDATISTIAFVAGGALLAGGAVLFLTAPASNARGSSPTVGVGLGTLTIRGQFQ